MVVTLLKYALTTSRIHHPKFQGRIMLQNIIAQNIIIFDDITDSLNNKVFMHFKYSLTASRIHHLKSDMAPEPRAASRAEKRHSRASLAACSAWESSTTLVRLAREALIPSLAIVRLAREQFFLCSGMFANTRTVREQYVSRGYCCSSYQVIPGRRIFEPI